MTSLGSSTRRPLAVRPQAQLVARGILAALAFFAPIFAVLFWLTIPRGTWLPVAVAQVLVLLVCLFPAIGAARSTIWVGPGSITERGILGRTRTYPDSAIGRVVLLGIYSGDADQVDPQLFVSRLDGRIAVRMRGQFWSLESMESVIEELGMPVTRIQEPLTLRELNRTHPELLYWFERRPVKRAA